MSPIAKAYMLDTNVFNRVVEGRIELSAFDGCRVAATSVQFAELSSTADSAKQAHLLSVFQALSPEMILTTGVWNDSVWGDCLWAAEDGLYEKLSARLTELDRRNHKLRKGFNLSRDIRIVEAAIRNALTLVTDDRNLRTVAMEFGGCAVSSTELSLK